MKAEEIRELCRKLKPVLGPRADKLWYFYLAQDEKGRRSFEQDIQIIAEKALRKEPLQNSQILLSPPAFEKSVGLFHLGDVCYNNKRLHPLNLNPSDFAKQVGIFSITGEGKTNTAMSLALQLLKCRVPFLVIDWKRSWRDLLSYEGETPIAHINYPAYAHLEYTFHSRVIAQ
jgi:DNA helicase HerA-like ATPase